MKTLKFLVLTVLVGTALVLSSCSKDEDSASIDKNKLYGKDWYEVGGDGSYVNITSTTVKTGTIGSIVSVTAKYTWDGNTMKLETGVKMEVLEVTDTKLRTKEDFAGLLTEEKEYTTTKPTK